MKKSIFLVLLCFLFLSCKTNQLRNKKRVGLWIEKTQIDTIEYKTIGKYRNGEPIKTWKYLENNRVTKNEKYRKDICYTTFYHSNGKIASFGKTKLTTKDFEIHWFYFDEWKNFDQNGKLIKIRIYKDGELISDKKVE